MEKIFVCLTADLPPGEARRVDCDPAVAVFNLDGTIYALADRCTHGEASMSDGYLEDDCTVECPVHTARFCLRTGRALTQPATVDLKTFEVLEDGDSLYVLVPTGESQ
ncbi:3-phenylpropionate/cinnamic acid dioxygenase ferredoxin subunit [Insolitispirillum peregrinum]|uniref:Phenylpropionate dioxygenase ferredoxin subunit n=1 Tax=Insolitispirillum peregrinum TaxID=80876 RepID=A0A1N7NBI5_9PROT|nr:3-phenylpropionate/cinnamic acid dioxygenase ferredoxin subunit [Insolitispirillum peregrinum]SIS95763.1 phenylpropionate dioxygenase ferredoxin subunit [Insolitispirillum peregrinum]